MDRLRLESEIESLLKTIKEKREKGCPDDWLETYTLGMKRALELITGNEYTVYDFALREVMKDVSIQN